MGGGVIRIRTTVEAAKYASAGGTGLVVLM